MFYTKEDDQRNEDNAVIQGPCLDFDKIESALKREGFSKKYIDGFTHGKSACYDAYDLNEYEIAQNLCELDEQAIYDRGLKDGKAFYINLLKGVIEGRRKIEKIKAEKVRLNKEDYGYMVIKKIEESEAEAIKKLSDLKFGKKSLGLGGFARSLIEKDKTKAKELVLLAAERLKKRKAKTRFEKGKRRAESAKRKIERAKRNAEKAKGRLSMALPTDKSKMAF